MLPVIRLVRGGAFAAFLLACAAIPAQAQFGGLKSRIKEKVAEKTAEKVVDRALGGGKDGADSAATAPAAAAPAAAPAPANNAGAAAAAAAGRANGARPAASQEPARRSPYGDHVLEMTPDVLDRFAAALAAENAERKAIPTRKREHEAASQKYGVCYYAALQSPEMEKVNARLAQAGEKNDVDLLIKASQEQQDLTKSKCGEPPEEPDYRRLVQAKAEEKGGFKGRQYDILKERLTPFCTAGAAITPDGDGVRIGGARIAYVYSATEVQQLKSRCGALNEALKAVL